MARIMIPMGGGLDSAVLLAEALAKTDHDIVAGHIREVDAPVMPADLREREREAAFRVVDWCSRNIRPVAGFEEGRTVDRRGGGETLSEDVMLPIRDGYAQEVVFLPTGAKWLSIGALADRVRPDAVWGGWHSWNFRRGIEQGMGSPYQMYRERTDVPLHHPFLLENHPERGFPVPGEYPGPGRMFQYRRLPEPLRELILSCKESDAEPCGECVYCSTVLFYKRYCEGRSDDEVRVIEETIERGGQYGRWYHDADPETYDHWRMFEWLRDRDWWDRALAAPTAEAA